MEDELRLMVDELGDSLDIDGIDQAAREDRLAAYRDRTIFVDTTDGYVSGGRVDHNRANDDQSPPDGAW